MFMAVMVVLMSRLEAVVLSMLPQVGLYASFYSELPQVPLSSRLEAIVLSMLP